MTATAPATLVLPEQEAATYAEWFASLAEPTRVRLLHTVAATPGGITVGQLTELLGISQSTCSHHVRKLADVGFLKLHKEGTSTRVTVNPACCVGLPHAADAVMGLLAPRPCCPTDVPSDVTVRAAGSPNSTAKSSAGPLCRRSPLASATRASPKAPSTSPTATAAEASGKP
jgi:DNA-binding transcriptional ArsR family regulator